MTTVRTTATELDREIDKARQEVRKDEFDFSIGEWLSMFDRHEVIINPEFQRNFRWTRRQRTNLIESVLLGIPVPPIYVSQREDGKWDVVDGVQRLSTILDFAGPEPVGGPSAESIRDGLLRTDALPSLEGKAYPRGEDAHEESTIGERNAIDFRRAKLRVVVLERGTSVRSKFELFERLNTGGTNLTEQEVRNAMLSELNLNLLQAIKSMAGDENFLDCVRLTDRQLDEQYDRELVVRFLVLLRATGSDLRKMDDVGEYLDEKAEEMALSSDLDLSAESDNFVRTFSMLAEALGGDAFRKWDPQRNRFRGGFLISAYEVVGIGLGAALHEGRSPEPDTIKQKVQDIWSEAEFTGNSGAGVRASSRIPKLVPLGKRLFG